MTARAGAATLGAVSTGARPRVAAAQHGPVFPGSLRERLRALLRDGGDGPLIPPQTADPSPFIVAAPGASPTPAAPGRSA